MTEFARKGREKRRQQQLAQRQARVEKVREFWPTVQHLHNAVRLMANELNMREPRDVKSLIIEAGFTLPTLPPAGPEPTKPAPPKPEKPLYKRGWTILRLFDEMLQHFDPPERDEDEDPSAPPPATEESKVHPAQTWLAWRVFLAAAFGLPPEDLLRNHANGEAMPGYVNAAPEDVPRGAAKIPTGATPEEIFTRCTGRKKWPTWASKVISLIVGRRGGKSYITALIGVYLACCRTYKLKLGTKGMVMILARDKAQAGVIREYVRAMVKTVDFLRETMEDEPTKNIIELKNGITIEIRAVGEAGTRGYTVVAALMDEIAFWPTDPESAKQDKKVMRAMRPATLGVPGSMLIMLSSPYAKRGELYDHWRKNYGREEAKHLSWQADTLSMRPDGSEELVDEIRDFYEEDPESAKAEYGGEFRSDLEAIFSRDALEAVSIPGRYEMGYDRNKRYRAFVDPSGGSSDSYVLAIAHDEERTVAGVKIKLPVLDKVVEWKAKFDPDDVSREVAQICQDYRVFKVVGDAYGGEWPRKALRKHGVNYELSEKTRSELYLEFVPMVNAKLCELLDAEHHRRVVNQFVNLERRVGRTGRDSVDHRQGEHDDIANAVAGVMVSAGTAQRVRGVWRSAKKKQRVARAA